MSFKPLTNLTEDAKPSEVTTNQKLFLSKDYKGKISSVQGFQCKRIYIAKIDQLIDKSSKPEIRILCGEDCKDKCAILHKTPAKINI